MTGQTWIIYGVSAVAGIGLGVFILTRTNWFKVRKYAIDVKRVMDRHKEIQTKTEQLQALGQQPNPVILQKHLRELTAAQTGLIKDLEGVKTPKTVEELHSDTLAMHRESLEFYKLMMVGGMRQKSLEGKQRKLMQMQNALQEKMEKVYGSMKKPAKK